MALQNITAEQERAINEALILFPDPLMRMAIMKAIDAVAGADSATLADHEARIAALEAAP